MAKPKTMNGTSLKVLIGDDASPKVFTHPCLINAARGIEFTSAGNEIIVPDCATPEDPAWVERVVDGLSATVTGAGIFDTTAVPRALFWDWYRLGTSKNLQVEVDVPLADGGGYWEGAFKLTSFSLTGERNNKVQFEATIQSDGVIAWEDASA